MSESHQDDPAPHPIPEPPPEPPEAEYVEPGYVRIAKRLFEVVIGPARLLTDPSLFHKVSLVAFLAWVGLGADGLSSSAYGPEAAFLALEGNTFLAIPLALLTAITVLIIATSYMRIIERFPTGGGGYVVATKLLGPGAGLASGTALLVDYVLTVAISLAACTESIFSIFPPEWQALELVATIALLGILTLLNLRGVRESVTVVAPIFLVFVLSHVAALGTGIVLGVAQIPAEVHHLREQSSLAVGQTGWIPLLLILFRAFTLGGGTYTGIEAVSNGVPMLREPKGETAKATMRYMAISLALIAGGILFSYLLYQVRPVPGKTLNAVLWSAIAGRALPPGSHLAEILMAVTLISAGALLFVAAQTGFLDAPRVLANMAVDRWVPSRFAHLSERLVASNGVLFVAISAFFVLLLTQGQVHVLVILYSINVFLTFSLSQLAMVRDAIHLRREGKTWRGPIVISGIGFVFTTSLLIGTVSFKFMEGGWATLFATALLSLVCIAIRKHYIDTNVSLSRLDEQLTTVPLPATEPTQAPLKRSAQTAILTVTAFGGLGIHSLLNLFRVFPNQFKQVVFISVGVIDSGRFKGKDELEALRISTERELQKYVDFARRLGLPAEYRYAIGTDIVDELEQICLELSKAFPRSVTFGGQLVFQKEGSFLRWLHNQTCAALQRRLAFHGLPMVILPVRVY
ncbi:MAG TPA: APC family permease [Candidatus Eisenbacteria bacterium]